MDNDKKMQDSGLNAQHSALMLGLDVGEVRIGVAISDDIGFGAHALCTIQSKGTKKDLEVLHQLVAEHDVAGVVVGIPHRLDGSVGIQAEKVQQFVKALQAHLEIPVFTWDERFTTVEAERILLATDVSRRKRKLVIDQVAAALMLESYLAHHQNREAT